MFYVHYKQPSSLPRAERRNGVWGTSRTRGKWKLISQGWWERRHQSTNPMKRGPCFCLLTMVYHCLSRTIADSTYLKIRCEMAQWAKVPAAKTDDLSWSPVNSHGGKRIDSCKVPLICTCALWHEPPTHKSNKWMFRKNSWSQQTLVSISGRFYCVIPALGRGRPTEWPSAGHWLWTAFSLGELLWCVE